MDGLFLKDTGVLLRDEDNALLDVHKADFPISLYDRPQLALSNLVLRGDVDAATRAMFSPQTLTPTEMKTFSKHLLQGKENPLLKTITDVFTNPLVIIGVIMALKYPMTGGTHNVFKVGQGLMNSPPGPLGSYVQSAFGNLRNLPNAFRILARWAKSTGDFLFEQGEGLNKAIATTGRLPSDSWLRVSAYLQGFHKAEAKGVTLGGTRMTIQKAYGLRKGQPLWPGLQKAMTREEISVAQKLRNWSDKMWGLISKDKKLFREFQADMKTKGITIGDKVEDYFPIYSKYSRLEGPAVYDILGGRKNYHFGLEKMRGYVAGALKKRQGVSLGQVKQLRRMEQLGMPPVVNDLMREVGKDTAKMEGFIRETWAGVAGIKNPGVQATSFMKRVLEKMAASKINVRARLGTSHIAQGALQKAAAQLAGESLYPERFNAAVKSIASVIMEPAQYDMRPIQSFRRYLTTAASSYTWHIQKAIHPATNAAVTGYKNLIDPVIKMAEAKGGFQPYYLSDQLVPLMRGLKPYKAYKRATTLGVYKNNALTWLTTHDLPKKMLTPNSQEWLKRYFSNFGGLSSESLGAKISEFFYVSTLGLNISPATKNLLQNYITLLHVPGISRAGFTEGMKEMMKGVGKYTTYLRSGVGREAAFHRAFPDYIKAVGKSSGMTRAMLKGDIAKEGALAPAALGSIWEKMKTGMLMPFSTSEGFNRLFGFYVGKHSHLAAGASVAEATEFGAMINHISHFPGGPLGMPRALLGMWSPARQFMHFPLRYMGFLMGSQALTGAKGLAKMRPLATSVGASAGLYTAAKNLLGVDLSQGLFTGALPVPTYEGAPFHPWPLVPPLVGIAGAIGKGVAAGESEQITRSLALMAPSGIAMRRLYKTLGPKYADYKSRTPDGRIPVYNDQHALIGAFTPWQLSLRAMGVSPSSQQAEYGAAKWLLTQREKIRAYRREYLEALSENDVNQAMKINEEFQGAYPELGPLQLKKSDITAVQNRREISRLNRILRGFPKAYQPLFGHMISQASLSQMTENLERQPSALESYLPLVSTLR